MKSFTALMLLVFAGAVMAAEAPMTLTKKNVAGWGASSRYQTRPVVTVENNVAKVQCGEIVPGSKFGEYQLSVINKQVFKAGRTYTFTFTVKSNMDLKKGKGAIMLWQKPYTRFAHTWIELTANQPKTFKLVIQPKEDISLVTRTPGFHLPMQAGQTFELSDLTMTESAQ